MGRDLLLKGTAQRSIKEQARVILKHTAEWQPLEVF